MSGEVSPQNNLAQTEFIFPGGNLAVDFVDTKRSRRIPGSSEIIQFDQLWSIDQVKAWWRAASSRYGLDVEAYAWREEDYAFAISLRSELREIFESIIAGRGTESPRILAMPRRASKPRIDSLNKALSRGSYELRSADGCFERSYRPRAGAADTLDPLAEIGLAASALLAEGDLGRLRACRSERCTLLFYDTTKSGTRLWCREACMNRSRARATYRKSKERKG